MSRRDRHPYPFHVGATCAPQIVASLSKPRKSPWPVVAFVAVFIFAAAFALRHAL
jgi:hypothetical protein